MNKPKKNSKKCLIIYFSLGGTTFKVANKISEGLLRSGYKVDLFNITENKHLTINKYSLIGIGFPVYMFRTPFNVIDYVKKLPSLDGIKYFVFILMGSGVIGSAGNKIRRILTKKKAREVGYLNLRGRDEYLGYLREGCLFSPQNPTKEELKQAFDFGHNLVDHMKVGFKKKPFDPPLKVLNYYIEIFLTCRFFVKYIYSWAFFLKKKKCTFEKKGCRVCIETCPVKNIKENRKRPVWRGFSCILCGYCELKCPEEAIISPFHFPFFRLFLKYNVKKGIQNPAVDHTFVVIKNGRIEPVKVKKVAQPFLLK